MEMTILGITFRVEVVIVCIILGWITGLIMFCSCSRYGFKEGYEKIKGDISHLVKNAASLDYKMSAGIEIKKNPEETVVGFMENFDNENIEPVSTCSI